MRTAITLAAAALALAAPAFAQDKTTLEYVTTKGTVVHANMQGQELELPMTYKTDGTYVTSAMGGGNENCIAYPAGKKPGDEFKVTNPMLGEVTIKINQ